MVKRGTFKTISVLIMVLPLALYGCGRAGAPLKPSEAAIERAKANKEPLPEAPVSNSTNEDKRFILDGLLD